MMAALFVFFIANPVRADLDETWFLSAGRSATSFNSEFKVNSLDDSVDKAVDLEDDLGYDNNVTAYWLAGFWRYSENHRIHITYLPIRRSTKATLTEDINIGDSIIKADAFASSNSRSNIYDIDYLYSFYKRPSIDLAFSVGLYWLQTRLELSAAGQIVIDDTEEPEFQENYKTHQKLNAPMPLLGFTASYEITPSWRIHGAARYLHASLDNIEGRLISLSFKTDYFFTHNWGLGMAITAFDLDVEHEGLVFNNNFSWNYEGAQAYFTFKY